MQKSRGTMKRVNPSVINADADYGLSMGNRAGTDPYAVRRKPVDSHVFVEPRRWSK